MSSQQQRRGRVTVNSTLAVMLVLGAILSPFVGMPTANVAAIAAAPAGQQPAALQAAEKTYFVEWTITASGYKEIQGSGYRTITKRNIEIKGEALYHKPAQGRATAIPMELTITDDMYQNKRGECSDEYEWTSITDPGRYTGGPDPFWSMSGVFWPHQAPDGTWSMDNPFVDWTFVANGELLRYFNYRTDQKHDDLCGGSHHDTHTYTNEMGYYADILRAVKDMPLRGDPTGTIFSLNTEYTVTGTYGVPLAVNFHATVRAGTCLGLSAPIDISDPALKLVDLNLQSEDTTPDGEATLKARVTCQGVPVINAPVVVKLKVQERSGGHNHTGGNRPRGYIDGVEQTANSKFISLTNSNGAVTFAIRPGRDLTDKTRGIAGLYMAEARVEWEGLTTPTARAHINARIDGLVPLLGDNLVDSRPAPSGHSEVLYGTPATVQAIQNAANTWALLQVLHNQSLSSKGMAPWPIRALTVFGISLPEGGLFDQMAWLGPRYMWRTPFGQHRTGEDVWVKSSWSNEPIIEQRLWYEGAFRALGTRYGTWFSDAGIPSNLKITKAPANLLQGSTLALGRGSSTNPDVAASAALMDPTGKFVAGAGQTVTYSVGVENLVSGTVASQVVLSATLPAGLNFISANPTPSRMQDPRTPIWDIGSLPDEAAPRVFEVIAQVDPSTAVGALLNITATATTSSPDADPTNDQFSDWGLTVQEPGPDLVIGSDLDATALTAGEPVTFTIQLSNDGNAPALNSRLDLTAPTGITITQTSPTATVIPNGLHWNAGELAPGGWQTFTVGLRVDPGLLDLAALGQDEEPEYPLSFTMTTGSDSTDIDPASNQMQVNKRVELPGPDLLVALQAEGTPDPGVFQVGQQVTYTLRYANFGNREADEVSTALLLWPGLTLMESLPAPTTNQLDPTSGVRTLTWNLDELSIGEEGAIQLRLRVDNVPESGSIIRSNISSNNIDLNPADNVVMEIRYKAYASNAGGYKIYLPFIKR
jgi:uncharacterized repeat protein (TIGR01451 family)